MKAQLDIATNRRSKNWTTREKIARVLWQFATLFFAFSPRLCWAWRRFLLRLFGAKIGRHVHIFPSVKVTIPWNLVVADYTAVGDGVILYALGKVTIGARVTISQGAHICAGTHDFRDKTMPLIKSAITIEDEAWVCADAFIGPDVTVGEGAVVGARAVVTRNVDKCAVVVGNPARIVGSR